MGIERGRAHVDVASTLNERALSVVAALFALDHTLHLDLIDTWGGRASFCPPPILLHQREQDVSSR